MIIKTDMWWWCFSKNIFLIAYHICRFYVVFRCCHKLHCCLCCHITKQNGNFNNCKQNTSDGLLPSEIFTWHCLDEFFELSRPRLKLFLLFFTYQSITTLTIIRHVENFGGTFWIQFLFVEENLDDKNTINQWKINLKKN